MAEIISVKNLNKEFKVSTQQPGLKGSFKGLFVRSESRLTALKGVSFEIQAGEIVGLIGLNGAGKTTTMKILSGLIYPTDGAVEVLGHQPFQRDHGYLKQISLVMGQKNQLWWDLPAIETFRLNQTIYDIPEGEFRKTLSELEQLLDVKDFLNRPVRKLSLGQRMRCELVAALLHKPKVLFMDEPTIGLDVVMQKKIRDFIREYNQRHQATILLTSHYMDDVKEVCQRIIMLDKGQKVFDGPIEELVKKNAGHKNLVVIFNQPVTKEELSSIGQVVEFDYPKAIIRVPREIVSQKAAQLHNLFDIDDLDISEQSLQDIVAGLCQGNR